MPSYPVPNSASLAEANDCHNPGGSPAGGEFCSTRGPAAFLAAVAALGTPVPGATQLSRRINVAIRVPPKGRVEVDASVDSKREGVVKLHSLEAMPMKAGAGSAILRQLCDLADMHHVTLELEAMPLEPRRGQKIPQTTLEALYERFGFEHDQTRGYMARKPYWRPMLRRPHPVK